MVSDRRRRVKWSSLPPQLLRIFLFEKACYEIIERLKTDKVDEGTLNRIKIKVRASVIRRLDSNSGMAELLASAHVNYGDWRKLFDAPGQFDRVTRAEIQAVAREILDKRRRTVGVLVPEEGTDAEAGEA